MLVSIIKLTNVDDGLVGAVIDLEDAKAITFTLIKLTLVDKLLFLVLDSLAKFLALSVHEGLPASKVHLTFIVE